MCKADYGHKAIVAALLAAAAVASACASAESGEEASARVSSSSAPIAMSGLSAARKDTDFSIVLVQNINNRHVEANYSFRWDFGDVKHFIPNIISSVTKPMTDPGSLDILNLVEITKVRLYGVSVSPSKLFIAQRNDPMIPSGASTSGGAAYISPAPQKKERTLQFSISPVINDIRDNIGDSLRNALIDETFYSISHKTSSVSLDKKKAVLDDLLSLDVMDGKKLPVKKLLRPETSSN